jgi:Tetratricopeptide repeat
MVRARESGDEETAFDCLYGLGMSAIALEQGVTAISHLQQALTSARHMGDQGRELHTLGGLGNAYSLVGRMQEVLGSFEQARALARGCGDLEGGSLPTSHEPATMPGHCE